MTKSRAKQIKIGLAILAVLIVIVAILQNTTSVNVKFLFLSMTMPTAVLIIFATLVGFVLGAASAGIFMRSRR